MSPNKGVVISDNFHFHKGDQTEEDSVTDCDASLRKLAQYCKFGDNLEDALRDRFV